MAVKPTADEIRAELEGYCITSSIVSDAWIERKRDNSVIPYIEGISRRSLRGVETVTEYYDGNGKNIIQIDRRGALALIQIEYVIIGDYTTELETTDFLLLGAQGLIKAVRSEYGAMTPAFPKGHQNIKITYTVGYEASDIPQDLHDAILYGTCEKMLGMVAGRGGGGDVSVTGYSKSYGNRGKWTDARNELARLFNASIHGYKVHTIGG